MCGGACGQELDDIVVADASFGDVDWVGVAAVVGVWTASGTLNITDTNGESFAFPIDLEGPTVGLVFDFAVSADDGCFFDDDATIDLSNAQAGLTARDIGGFYGGTSAGAHMGVGVVEHELANGQGVRIKGGGTSAGMGMWIGLEWLGLSLQ
jgi:hypothetical protein